MSVSSPSRPWPPFGRMMLFIDGENLVLRYQQMVDAGYIPHDDIEHERDTFVWCSSRPHFPDQHVILRANYYTYATGSDEYISEVEGRLRNLTYKRAYGSQLPNNLYPQVFKKARREVKGKGVDIQMTVDILTHVYQNNLDTVYLLSGDGDYRPVIDTTIRNGKQIYVAAFSSGLNPTLPRRVDKFTLLDSVYFRSNPAGQQLS